MFKIKDLADGKLLNYQSLKMQDAVDLCKYINQMFKDGYVIEEDFIPRNCPKIPRLFNLKFIKPSDTPSDEIDDDEEIEIDEDDSSSETIDIDSLNKKDELLAFAEKAYIEIPEDVTHPMSIKKFIKDNLKG